jgi:hypothetical protein
MNSTSLCSLAGRYGNLIPTRFLAPIDCLKFQLSSLSYLRLILGDPRQALAESRLHLRHVVVQVCPHGPGLSLEALKVVCVQFPIVGPILLALDLRPIM